MASDTNSTYPNDSDTIEVLARELLEAANDLAGGSVSTPPYSEGTLPMKTDTLRRTLVKAVYALRAANGVNVGSEIVYLSRESTVNADGTTDDAAAIQAIVDANPGKTIVFEPGATYRVDTRLIFENVTVWAYDATVNLVVTAVTTGHCLRNYTTIFGGTWNTQYTSGTATNGSSFTVFNIGSYAGENEAGGTGHHDIVLQDVTITDSYSNANAIWISGDSYNVHIKNLTVPASATIGRAIACHWGGWKTPGTYSVGDTKHPHNINVENVYCGALTYVAGTWEVAPLFFSGSYNISVKNVVCEEAATAVLLYAGDVGFRWASVTENALAFSGMSFQGVFVKRCRNYGSLTFGLSTDTSNVVWRIPAHFKDCAWRGPADATLTGSTDYAGISPRAVDGLIYENCTVSGFEYGAYAIEHPGHSAGNYRVHDIQIIGGQYHGNYLNGVYVHNADISLLGWKIHRINAYLNGVAGSLFTTAGIRMGRQTSCEIVGCILGDAVDETLQAYGVRVENTSVTLKVSGNYCLDAAAAAGVGFSFGSSTDDGQAMCSEVSSNTKGTLAGANALYSGALNLPVHGGYKGTEAGNAAASVDMAPNGASCVVYDVPITADRAVSFANFTQPGARGRVVRIIRTVNATGAFNVNVGTGPLVALSAVKQWCDVETDGAAVRLVGYGTLP